MTPAKPTPRPRSHEPSASAARTAIQQAGVEAYPEAITPDRLLELGGRTYPSRIHELTVAGWSWEAVYSAGDPRPSYRLRSLERGTPDPVRWGLRARLGEATGLVVEEYGTGQVRLPPAAWERLQARIQRVIQEDLALAGVLGAPVKKVVEEEEGLPLFELEFGDDEVEPAPRTPPPSQATADALYAAIVYGD